MRAKKSLGQNFLMHAQTAERIAEGAQVTAEDTVLEIGPGTGKLTRALLARAKKVIAIEADAQLEAQLRAARAQEIASGKLELIAGDARHFDTSTIAGPYKLVANIPYYITGELIRQFLTAPHQPESMTLLVQKEVAERVAREEKGSLLSLSVRVYGTPAYLFTVPRGAFVPAPSVDSAVLRIHGIHRSFASPAAEQRFFEVLRAGFAHKRKLLRGNLEQVAEPTNVLAAFASCKIAENARAEDLSISEWQALAAALA